MIVVWIVLGIIVTLLTMGGLFLLITYLWIKKEEREKEDG